MIFRKRNGVEERELSLGIGMVFSERNDFQFNNRLMLSMVVQVPHFVSFVLWVFWVDTYAKALSRSSC